MVREDMGRGVRGEKRGLVFTLNEIEVNLSFFPLLYIMF